MADLATAKKSTRPSASFARRYGLAFASVTGALLLELLFHYFNLPHPFAAFALSAIAITFWYGGTKPGIVAVLLSSLIRIANQQKTLLRGCQRGDSTGSLQCPAIAQMCIGAATGISYARIC